MARNIICIAVGLAMAMAAVMLSGCASQSAAEENSYLFRT
jgi:hypothetical protein